MTDWEDLHIPTRTIKSLEGAGWKTPEALAEFVDKQQLTKRQLKGRLKRLLYVGPSTVDTIEHFLDGWRIAKDFTEAAAKVKLVDVGEDEDGAFQINTDVIEDEDWEEGETEDLGAETDVLGATAQVQGYSQDFLRQQFYNEIEREVTPVLVGMLKAGYSITDAPGLTMQLLINMAHEYSRWREGYDPVSKQWVNEPVAEEEEGMTTQEWNF